MSAVSYQAVLAIAGAILALSSIASDWRTSDTICHVAATCSSNQLDAAAARTLSRYGISIDDFAAYIIVLRQTLVAIFYGLGALILWRKPDDRAELATASTFRVAPDDLQAIETGAAAVADQLRTRQRKPAAAVRGGLRVG